MKARLCLKCDTLNLVNARRCRKCNSTMDMGAEILEVSSLDENRETIADNSKINEDVIVTKCPVCNSIVNNDDIICPICNNLLSTKSVPKVNQSKCSIILKLNDGTTTFSSSDGYKYFGRKYSCGLGDISNNYSISSIHFLLLYLNNTFFIVDVSSNGTKVNGIKLVRGELKPLSNHDVIDCVGVKIEVLF